MSDSKNIHEESHVPHHFDSARQQYESNKMGIWLFLCTEIMMFGGLFCGYAVYRANHPEIFVYAHQFLDTTLGGINTLVLICSSLSMAWAVRAAQLSQKKVLIVMLVITFFCACTFMCIKGVEYNSKWKHGLLWGKQYKPAHHESHDGADEQELAVAVHEPAAEGAQTETAPVENIQQLPEDLSSAVEQGVATATGLVKQKSDLPPPGAGPEGLSSGADVEGHDISEPINTQVFFGIYFMMTGLHGIHVLVGMGLILWLTVLAGRGKLHSKNFMPVDMVGLYWHLVDLIWIFLFPLLYLIH